MLASTLHLIKDFPLNIEVRDIRQLPWVWSKLIWWQRLVDSILEAAAYDPEKLIPAKSYDWLDDPKKVFDDLEERRKHFSKQGD